MRVHGTNSMYHDGCRCESCKVAHKIYENDRYRRRAKGINTRKKPVYTAMKTPTVKRVVDVDRMLELAFGTRKKREPLQADVVSACEERKTA